MVKSESVFSPQTYLEEVTGKCYIVCSDTISGLIDKIECVLFENGHKQIRNFQFTEIDKIVSSGADVVLVELSGEDRRGKWNTVFHWFEIPKDVGGR